MQRFVVAAFALWAGAAFAGHVDLSGGISVFTPPDEGADTTPLYHVDASYWFTKRATVNAEVGYANYRVGAVVYYYVPNKLRVISHPNAGRLLDPYFGGGFVYTKKKNNASGWGTKFGYSGLLGFNFLLLHNATVGGYAEYIIPDWRSTDGYWEYGFNFGGIKF